MSAAIGAALKKILAATVTNPKVLKTLCGIALGLLIMIFMPIAALLAIFSPERQPADITSIAQTVQDNMTPEEEMELQFFEMTMTDLELMMGVNGFGDRVMEADILYVMALEDFAHDTGFVDKLVGCFRAGQTDAELIAAVNAAFGTSIDAADFTKMMIPYRSTYINVTDYVDLATKNNLDLVKWAIHAHEAQWGYLWGTYGQVLTQFLFETKQEQYPDEIRPHIQFIQENWMGRRVVDCAGLIKGYGWLDAEANLIIYNSNGMPDIGANTMYANATEKGTIDTMPEIPGLAVWKDGHIGIYIGNGLTIEAMGTEYGVVKRSLSSGSWTHWLKIPYITYIEETTNETEVTQ